MQPTRHYVRSLEAAQAAVAEITRLVKGGFVDPLVSFDLETQPIAGLENYPGTTFDEAGERVKSTKKMYLEFAQKVWFDNFNPAKLFTLGIEVPRKLSTGNERPGVPAKAAWAEFLAAVTAASAADLESARWTTGSLFAYARKNLVGRLEELQTLATELDGVKGKKKALEAVAAEQALLAWRAGRLDTARERLETPLDLRLLRHVVAVGVENRVKVDPVAPGLDPFTSEIFTVQITLRGTLDRALTTWVFNGNLYPIEAIKKVFKLGRAYTYMAHNAKFDLKMLMAKMGLDAAPRNVFCTRIGSRMLYLGLKKMQHNLKVVAMRFAGLEMEKAVRDTFIGVRRLEPTEEQVDYGAFDTEVLFPVYDAQMAKAAERGQVELLQEFARLSWIVAKWELDGYRVDTEKWNAITAAATTERDALARQLEDLLLPEGYREAFSATATYEDDEALDELETDALDNQDEDAPAVDVRRDAIIRISQVKLVATRLAELLGEKVTTKAFPDGKCSIGKDARGTWERAYREMYGGETHSFFLLYERWSKLAKQVSTYGKKFLWALHPLTGAVHPSLNIAGTDTARFSSNRPNLLNIPAAKEEGDPDFRGAFITQEGFLWLGADYDSMELKIAGCVTQEPVLQKLFASGRDGHAFTAAMMFHIRRAKVSAVRKVAEKFKYGTSVLDITVYEVPESWSNAKIAEFALTDEVVDVVMAVKKKTTRTVAKMVTFLWLFRGSGFTLAIRTGLPQAQCDDFFLRFNSVYNTMAAGMDELAGRVLKQVVEGNDGVEYAWAEGYGGLIRWWALPSNPSRRDYGPGWAGDAQFNSAQYIYKKRLRSIQRESCNVPCQGGNAVITARALNLLVEAGHPMGVYPVLAIYDEILTVFPVSVAPETVKGMLEGCMLEAAAEYMTYIPASCEADVKKAGTKWVKS